MRTVTVGRAALLDKLRVNREQHRAIFESAIDGYRNMIVAELEQRIDDLKKGKEIDRIIRLEAPVDHTEDYDRVILMAEMNISDEIELDEDNFAQYVMDQWRWKAAFISNAGTYTSV